jgi:hypothetical protein
MKKYHTDGYPRNNGLAAAGISIRSSTEDVKKLCQTWWQEVEHFSFRDQLSFNYAAWKSRVFYDTMPHEVLFNNFVYKRRHLKLRHYEHAIDQTSQKNERGHT